MDWSLIVKLAIIEGMVIDFGSPFITVLSIVNYLFIIFILFFENRDSAKRFAWIFTLSFLPGIGIIAYLLFSGHFFTKTRKMEEAQKFLKKETAQLMQEQQLFFKNRAGKLPNEVMNEYASLVNMNLQNDNSPITFTDSVQIFTHGEDKFEALFADIENAKTSVYLQYFIIRKDKTGIKLMDLLCAKAKEGLDVKLLYDDMGSILSPRSFFMRLDKAGGISLAFFPIKRGNLLSINFRNHRKIAIIDGKIGYTGGFNVGDEYAGLKKLVWRDTHVRLTGSCVLSLLSLFLVDWYGVAHGKKALESLDSIKRIWHLKRKHHKTLIAPNLAAINSNILADLEKDVPGDAHIPTQIISSGPGNALKTEIKDSMIRMIMSAKKSIFIQTPYFTPDTSFFSALKIAALSGIDIRIMLPGQWDKFYVRAAAFAFIRDMIPLSIKFYKYPGFIHAKTLIIDGKILTIGSCNIDNRSFELHYEANVVFYDEVFTKQYESMFLNDQALCSKYKLDWFNSRPLFQRGWWGFCKLFSPLM